MTDAAPLLKRLQHYHKVKGNLGKGEVTKKVAK